MHDSNRDGLNRHTNNVGSTVAIVSPAIPGLAGSTRKFLAVIGRIVQ
jgi:hypothetical protein